MRRKIALAAALTIALLAAASPAEAATLGAKTYDYPGHCGAYVQPYIGTFQATTDQAEGAAYLWSCGYAGFDHVTVYFIKLWKNPGNPVQLATGRPLDFPLTIQFGGRPNNDATVQTAPVGCLHAQISPGIYDGQTAWAEIKYQAFFDDGTNTTVKDVNSFNVTFTSHAQCH